MVKVNFTNGKEGGNPVEEIITCIKELLAQDGAGDYIESKGEKRMRMYHGRTYIIDSLGIIEQRIRIYSKTTNSGRIEVMYLPDSDYVEIIGLSDKSYDEIVDRVGYTYDYQIKAILKPYHHGINEYIAD